eukprot:c5476_g1_i1.p2 GENE.c5476_g1_i1~~c5476_g1_i1.p2  ORF type:complete len:116 (+),score=31.78 c5476_g1_i1:225-572(+)
MPFDMAKRLNDVEEKLIDVEGRLISIEGRLINVETKLEKLTDIEAKLETLINIVGSLVQTANQKHDPLTLPFVTTQANQLTPPFHSTGNAPKRKKRRQKKGASAGIKNPNDKDWQ